MTVVTHPTLTATATSSPVKPAPDPTVIVSHGDSETRLIPVRNADRTIGAYVLIGGRVRYLPAMDVGHVLAAAAGMVAVGAVAVAVAATVVGHRPSEPSRWARVAG